MEAGRLLAIGAHTDDIELGAGGTIARALASGWEVHYLVFSIARESVPQGFAPEVLRSEATNAAQLMGVAGGHLTILDFPVRRFPSHRQQILDELIKARRNRFDVVLCHNLSDVHQDHETVAAECVRAFKSVRCLLGYDLPWNSVTKTSSQPDFFVTLSEDDVHRKTLALSAFETQAYLGRPYFQKGFVHSWAGFRGAQVGSAFAEAFHLVRATV